MITFINRTLILLTVLYILFTIYLLIPNIDFPSPPSYAVQSNEPADIESSQRRAYFTDFTREQVLSHYLVQMGSFPVVRLNYPPEEAGTLVRDQTRSTYLEEIVHPFRESLFVNGFEPRNASDSILVEGRTYEQKITVKHIQSNLFTRFLFSTSIFLVLFVFMREFIDLYNYLRSWWK